MLGVLGRNILLPVACVALGWCTGEFVAGVTLDARLRAMRTGQREGGQVVVEGSSPAEGGDAVALLAGGSEPRRAV